MEILATAAPRAATNTTPTTAAGTTPATTATTAKKVVVSMAAVAVVAGTLGAAKVLGDVGVFSADAVVAGITKL